MPSPPEIDYFPLLGGVDQASAPLAIFPGRLLSTVNFEIAKTGKGYRYPEGYERFDGQAAPSSATFTRIDFSAGRDQILDGETVTTNAGGSGSIGVAVIDAVLETGSYDDDDATGYVVLWVTSGTFLATDQLKVAADIHADCDTVYADGAGAPDTTTEATWVALCVAEARSNIAAVPGTGDVLGVHRYKGVLYAFRNNAGDTATDMYKQTTSGWSKVDLGNVLSFDSGGTTAITTSDTLTGQTSNASADVLKVVVTSGTWTGGDAAGFVVLGTITGGPYQNNELLDGSVGGANLATADGVNSANAIVKDGRFELINYNFGGHAGTVSMLGVNGVGKAFEYDGSAFCFITTGMTTDTPDHIIAHQNHLFLSFAGGSVQHSSLVDNPLTAPHVWSAVTGAAEFGLGDEVNGFVQTAGETLTIFTVNRTKILYGESSANWNLQDHSDTAGATEWTIQKLNEPIYVDSENITSMTATQVYGGMSIAGISSDIQDFMVTNAGNEIASAVNLKKNQYILFYNDDKYITLTIAKEGLAGFMFGELTDTPTCACYDEDSGEVFFGSDDGFVYEMSKGTSHDGDAILAYIQIPFNFLKTPEITKIYHKVIYEMDTEKSSSISFNFTPQFDYMNSNVPTAEERTISFLGGNLQWDVDPWDTYNWYSDSDTNEEPVAYIDGTASEIGLLIYVNSATQTPFTMNGVFIKYSVLGGER